jgi:hypothetical protein
MLKGIEYHGRLTRRDGRPANPGTYSLRFALHSDARTRRSSWTEDIEEVEVSPGGFFNVVLGLSEPLKPALFKSGPRWVSVTVLRKGEVSEETTARTPLTGTPVLMLDLLERLERRVERLEQVQTEQKEMPSPQLLSERLHKLEGRVTVLSDGDLPSLSRRLERLAGRVQALDEDDGRLDRMEDRLDDIDGEGGDLLDLHERLDELEKELAPRRDHG